VLDTSIASVPLDEVFFDTFRGGIIPLSVASRGDIGRLRDAIKPIYSPEYDDVEGGHWLGDDDVVVGYVSTAGRTPIPSRS
jgi:hypothetical protein